MTQSDRRRAAERAVGSSGSAAAQTAPARHLGSGGGARLWKSAAVVLSLLLVSVLAFVSVQLFRLQANVDTQPLNIGADQGQALPVDLSTDAVQILILGTDNRRDKSGRVGISSGSTGGNSDVMMLLNLSADRQTVSVVSFPRDLLVPLPSCVDPASGQSSAPMDLGQLNSALSFGGPGCTVAAINELTGLTIDHFMMADFNAVKELSQTLGGVEVCVNEAVEDTYSGLSLPAGTSEVQGDQALAFLRTRHGFGDGGDKGRIRAQQSFLASMARKVKDEGTLTNIPRVYRIAEAVTRNLTVNDGLSEVSELLKLAQRLQDVDLTNIAFVTVPTKPYEADPNRLVLNEDRADALFTALAEDRSLTKPSGSASQKPTPTKTGPATPIDVPVLVLNGTDRPDRAAAVQKLLASKGYVSTATADANQLEASQILFGPGYEQAARALAKQLGVDEVQLIPSPPSNGIELYVGADFARGTTVEKDALRDDLNGQTADQVTCQSASGL